MTSFACVPVGRLMLSDEALLAVPLLLVAEPRYPMMYAPGQVSATSHSPAAARHTAPPLPGKCWQLVLVPSQGLVSAVQAVPDAFLASVGQVVLDPVQVSATSHSPAPARQTVAALPAGCWQLVLVPSHWSRVQGLPSSVQAVPLAFRGPSAGHVELEPVHVSGRSHSPAAARQTAPPLPAGCWQLVLVPLHWSRVQALPSSVHAVPLAFRGPSAGHVALEPVQVSGRSQSPAAARQVFVLLAKVQLFLQHEPAAPF